MMFYPVVSCPMYLCNINLRIDLLVDRLRVRRLERLAPSSAVIEKISPGFAVLGSNVLSRVGNQGNAL